EEQLREAHRTLERRVVERTAELRSANETLAALIDGSPLAIYTLDREGRVRTWNRTATELFGWTEQEVLGQLPPFVPEDRLNEFHRNRTVAINEQQVVSMETYRQRKDGTRLEVHVRYAPSRDAEGQVT